MYSLAAAQFLGSIESGVGLPSLSQWAKKQAECLKVGTISVAQKVKDIGGDQDRLTLTNNVARAIDASEGSVEATKLAKEILRKSSLQENALRVLWKQTVVDITSTVHEACQMVLHDSNVSMDTRKRRAEGLSELGKIFEDATGQSKPIPEQEGLEQLAFHAMLDTIWRQEESARTHQC